jgi:hypothetical protein
MQIALAEGDAAPAITNLHDFTMDEDGTRQLTFDVADNDGVTPPGDIVITASSGDTDILGSLSPSNSGGNVSIEISPKKDKNGNVTVAITARDGDGNETTAQAIVQIDEKNDAPNAKNDTANLSEDGTERIKVLENDEDVDGDALTITGIIQDPQYGTASVDGSEIVYIPNDNWYGDDSLEYGITDGSETSTATLTIHVESVNDRPVAEGNTVSTNENEPVEITLSGSDPEGDEIHFVIADDSDIAGKGSLGSISGNKVTFTPEDYWNGSTHFTYKSNDGTDDSDAVTVNITVNDVNFAPVADDFSEDVAEDTAKEITLKAHDPDGDALNVTLEDISGITGKGTLGALVDGKVTFTPAENYHGTAAFTYKASDANLDSNIGTVTINIQAANDDPVAMDDSDSVDEDASLDLYVLTNDDDPDLHDAGSTEQLTVSDPGTPVHGTVTLNSAKDTITYTPSGNWNGTDKFTYTMTDKSGATATAEVTIEVTPQPDDPKAKEDSYTSPEDTIAIMDVLTNDGDPDIALNGDAIQVTAVTQPEKGTVAIGSGGQTIEFTPPLDYTGTITFTYTISDNNAATSTAGVSLTITQENDPPVAVADTAEVNEDGSVPIDVVTNDEDPDLGLDPDEDLKIKETGAVAHGTVSISNDKKTIIYTPNNNWNGTENFSYTVEDKEHLSSEAQVTVTVQAENDAPVAKNDSYSILEDASPLLNVLQNDTDIDFSDASADAHTLIGFTQPSNGVVSIEDNQIRYQAKANWYGTETFTYTLCDKGNAEATATVTVVVSSVNDKPAFTNLLSGYSVDEDNPITITFDISDMETATESLMLQYYSSNQGVVADSGIALSGMGNSTSGRSVTVTPKANANGTTTIMLRLSDGFLVTDFPILLTVNAVNDAPAANTDSFNFTEDTPCTIDMDSLVNNDTDIENNALSYISHTVPEGFSGTLTVYGDPSEHVYLYTPTANFNGTTTFNYTISDGTASKTGTVRLVGIAKNDDPTIVMDLDNVYSTNEDVMYEDIGFTVGDVETGADSLIITAKCSDPDIIQDGNISIVRGTDGHCNLKITPNADKHGTRDVTITVSDGTIAMNLTFAFEVLSVEDNPMAVDDVFSMSEDTSLSIAPLENDYDRDGDTISITSINSNTNLSSAISTDHGTITVNGSDSLVYIPDPGYDGPDSFTYIISDGHSTPAEAAVSLTISGENDPPHFKPIADQNIDEDHDTGAILFTMTDPDGADSWTYTAVSSDQALIPDTNVVVDKTAKTIICTPLGDANGQTRITLSVTDSGGLTDTVAFDVKVHPVNDAPVFADFSKVSVTEDTAASISLLEGAYDADGDTLQVVSVTDPTKGALSMTAPGVYSYKPNHDYNGSDTFDFVVADGGGLTTAAVTLNIGGVNDRPVAYDDYLVVAASGDTVVSAMGNDYDVDTTYGDSISIDQILDGPDYGTASINTENNTIVYTKEETAGAKYDTITYQIIDESGATDQATIHIARTDVYGNYTPVLGGFSTEINEDSGAHTYHPFIFDPDSSTFTIHFVSPPTKGTAEENNIAKSIVYTPGLNENGQETFTYYVTDDQDNNSSTATGNIYIIPINDEPSITAPDEVTTQEDIQSEEITVTISDPETAASDLLFSAYPADESLLPKTGISIGANNNGTIKLRLTPGKNKSEDVDLYLVASDGLVKKIKKLTLKVSSVNDAPDAKDYTVQTNEEVPITVAVRSDTTDADNAASDITVEITESAMHGTATNNGDGTITYTPEKDYFGQDTFAYKLTDTGNESDTGVVLINVANINDAPYIGELDYVQSTPEDTTKIISFKIYDADGDSLTLSKSSKDQDLIADEKISLALEETDATLTFKPEQDQYGVTSMTVSADDGKETATAEFEMRVLSINDLPVANYDNADVDEDHSVTIDLTENDSDLEDGTVQVISFTTPAHGTVVNNYDGTATYTPSANYNGTDEFIYNVSDNNAGTAGAYVYITINSVNDAPNAAADYKTMSEDAGTIDIDAFANDSDVDNMKSSLVITGHTAPVHGTLEVVDEATGRYRYTPNADYYGTDTFNYSLSDGSLTSTGTVTITISALNDAPRVTPVSSDPFTFNEDTVGEVQVDIYDPEMSTNSLITQVTSLQQGIIKDTAIKYLGTGRSRRLELTPVKDANGSLDVRITVSDGINTTVYDYGIVVDSVNDAPTLTGASATTNEDTAVTGTVTGSDLETATANLVYSLKTGGEPAHGTAVISTNGSWTYTPNGDFNGMDTFTAVVSDNDPDDPPLTAEATVTITVKADNDAPQAVDDEAETNEDNAKTITLTTNDIDPDLSDASSAEDLTVKSFTQPQHGTTAGGTNNKDIVYTPAQNYNGTDSFTYVVEDTTGETSEASVSVAVKAVNDLPVANPDSTSVNEDGTVDINVVFNDTDVDTGDLNSTETLTVTSPGTAGHGSLQIISNKIRYTPEANYYGSDSFTYTITDKAGEPSSALVSVNVVSQNDLPTITGLTSPVTTNEDTATAEIPFTIADVENLPADLTLSAVSGNTALIPVGNIVFGGSGANRTIKLTPTANKNGSTTVTIKVTDKNTGVGQAAFTFNVTAVNDAPVAVIDSVSTPEETAGTFNVLSNDTDADKSDTGSTEALSIKSIGNAAHGTTSIVNNQAVYVPEQDYNGTDSFTYTITDKEGVYTSTATVNVTVTAVNDRPQISGITGPLEIYEDHSTSALDFTVSDVDNSAASLTVSRASSNTNLLPIAGITIGGSGANRTVTAAPIANINGPVDITLTVSDGSLTNTMTFRLNVKYVNDAPVAYDDDLSTPEDTPKSLGLLTNDIDVDITTNPGEDAISILSVTQPSNGVVTVSTDKQSINFTPDANWNGTDSFSYTVTDTGMGGVALTATGTVNIEVSAENDVPVAKDDSFSTDEDTPIDWDIIANDTDADTGDKDSTEGITIFSVDKPLHGTVIVQSDDKTIRYTPDQDWNGAEEFNYVVCDTHNAQKSGKISVTVNPVNDDPVPKADDETVQEDNDVVIYALLNDGDADLYDQNSTEHLTITEVSTPGHGEVKIESGTAIKYTPDADFNGDDSFTYTVTDQDGASVSTGVSVTVNSVNDAPKALTDEAETDEETLASIDVLANDQDKDFETNPSYEDLAIVSAAAPHGEVSLAPDKKLLFYTPKFDYNGKDTISYTMRDRDGLTSSSTVIVQVNPVNDKPQAKDDTYEIQEDSTNTLDVLANDMDVDLNDVPLKESLSIVSVEDPGHGTAIIKDNMIHYKMDDDYDSDDSFGYTMKDNAGEVSNAEVYISIDPVNDPPTTPVFTLPFKESYYKKSQIVHVRWNPSTDVDGDAITYTLEYFNGTSYITVAKELKENEYDFTLPDEDINTLAAHFRVQAFDEHDLSSGKALSNDFIIDNMAPVNTALALVAGGKTYKTGKWTNQNVSLHISGTHDVLPFSDYYRVTKKGVTAQAQDSKQVVTGKAGSGEWLTSTDGLLSDTCVYTLEYRAIDILGNTSAIKTATVCIDKLAPGAVTFALSTQSQTNKDVTITAAAPEDTGGSGNAYVVLPSGKTAALVNSTVQYAAAANGVYSFTLYDNAGNSTVAKTTIANIDSRGPVVTAENHGYSNGTWSNKPIEVALSYKDADSDLSAKKYSVTQSGAEAGELTSYTNDIVMDHEGSYDIHYYAKDKAGNTATGIFGTYKIDLTNPELLLELSGNETDGYAVLFKGSDVLSGAETVTLPDGTRSNVLNGSFKVSKNGEFTFQCMDEAGNKTEEKLTCDSIGSVPAMSNITLPVTNGKDMNQTDDGFAGSAIDVKLDPGEVDAFIWTENEKVDNEKWTPLKSTYQIKDDNLPEGIWYLHVKKDNKITTIKYVIDRTPPEIIAETLYLWIAEHVRLKATDAGSGMDRIEGDDMTGIEALVKLYLFDGDYAFMAYDKAGNAAAYTVKIRGLFPWWIILIGILLIILLIILLKDKIYKTGDEPGKGVYFCINCHTDQQIYNDDQKLQDCANCEKNKFKRRKLRKNAKHG